MSKVICFSSAKGGSGKTTLTASFGKLLSEFGKSVLMIDFDEATNGLSLLFINEIVRFSDGLNLKSSDLCGVFPVSNEITSIVPISNELHLAPAAFEFSEYKQEQVRDYKIRINKIIRTFEEKYDFILIDAQAGSDAASLAAVDPNVSDLIVLISEFDPMSAAGIERLKGLEPSSFSFERTYILLNKLLPEFVKSFEDFFSVSHYLPPIPWTADAVRAYSKRGIAIDTEQGNEFTIAILQAMRALPVPIIQNSYEDWVRDRAPMIRQPIDEQYADTEELLLSSMKRLKELSIKRERDAKLRSLRISVAIAVTITAIAAMIFYFFRSNIYVFGIDQVFPRFGLSFGMSVLGAIVIAQLLSLKMSELVFKVNRDRVSIAEFEVEKVERQQAVYRKKLQELDFLREASDKDLIDRKFSGRSLELSIDDSSEKKGWWQRQFR